VVLAIAFKLLLLHLPPPAPEDRSHAREDPIPSIVQEARVGIVLAQAGAGPEPPPAALPLVLPSTAAGSSVIIVIVLAILGVASAFHRVFLFFIVGDGIAIVAVLTRTFLPPFSSRSGGRWKSPADDAS
jgi:hypothetical protein